MHRHRTNEHSEVKLFDSIDVSFYSIKGIPNVTPITVPTIFKGTYLTPD